MKTYHRLSLEEREEISRQLAVGASLRSIAVMLGRSPSTISREVNVGSVTRSSYRAHRADRRALRKARKRRVGHRKLMKDSRLQREVEYLLTRFFSPEQIAHMLKQMYPKDETMRVAPETIYTYLYVLPRGSLKKELVRFLRQSHAWRHKRSNPRNRGHMGTIPDMVSIEERPADVADRTIPGHWEGDLIVGVHNKSALGTLVERTTRTVLLVPLKGKTAPEVRRAFARAVRRVPTNLRKSLTYDRGWEMAEHRLFTKETQMQVYFAHPQSPWERGTNENTNGLIRQFFPKGTDFTQVPYHRIRRAEHLLNTRPRKTLNWRTPYEALADVLR
jgi:transposase, IS30 family